MNETPTFDYFVSQVRVATYGFVKTGGDERESEPVYRGWAQVTADTLDESIPEIGVELKTLLEPESPVVMTDGGVKSDTVTTRHTVEQFRREEQPALRADGGDAEELPPLHVGDHVQDREEPDTTLLVVGLPLQRAATYVVDEDSGATVADYNDDYPETDHAIEVIYPQRTDVFTNEQQRYAFPRARLELVTPVHDVEGGSGS